MMRKYMSRLVALFLVLSMVVLFVPVQAQAADITRPAGYTDEEWEEYLRMLRLQAEQAELAAKAGTVTSTETATDGSEVTVTPPSADSVPKQSVTVDVPVEDAAEVTGDTAVTDGTVTIPAEGEGADPTTVDATITEEYDLNANVSKVEITDGEITDIEYDISMDKTTTYTEEKAEGDTSDPYVKTETTEDVDIQQNQEAKENGTPAPQYRVNMTVNGMQDAPTRVEHRYKETDDGEEKVEYYYNADNGIDETDTSKKYFTTSGFDKQEKESTSLVETVTNKVVSLWTSFLGIFHITNDAFENQNSKEMSSTLSGAVNGANAGDTVDMLRDYDTTKSAEVDKNVTVDLNGNTYTNSGTGAAMDVTGSNVAIENGAIISGGTGVEVGSTNKGFSLKNLFLKSNADNKANAETAGLKVAASGNTTTVENSVVDSTNSRYGIQYTGEGSGSSTLKVKNSDVFGGTGVAVKDANAKIANSVVIGTDKAKTATDSGAAVSVEQSSAGKSVEITGGLFDSARDVENIYATSKNAIDSITIKGGRFTNPDDLYSYLPNGRALLSHNDGSYFVYEVVGTDYTPTRDGYRFLGYTDGKGHAITLAQAAKNGIIAYAQWKAIPEEVKEVPLITVKTDEKDCTTKVTIKGDTAFVTVKDKDGEFAPISEVTIPSVKRLQDKDIDTVEIQVDKDVTLVLDVEKAKKNGFTDTVEVNLEKDTLLITSGKDTCIELDIAVLKASDKPVEIQLVEGELTVTLGKSSSLSVDLTKALKRGERIVVKLENGVLKLYDKYNKPIEEN